MNKIEALNDIVTGLGGSGVNKYEIQALNAWAVLVGAAGGYKYEIQALNAIDKAKGGTGLHKYNIDALNSICKAAGGSGVNKYEIQALAFIGSNVNQISPADFVSTFNVDTISADLSWTDTNSGKAKYLIYRSVNGGTETLVATTDTGATSYSDTACKQNASVVYRIKAERKDEYIAAAALATPLCWKANQSTLVTITITKILILAEKTVTLAWGDGTSQVLTGNNLAITKEYLQAGDYNIALSGDTDSIKVIDLSSQPKFYGNIGNWVLPNLTELRLNHTGLTGNLVNWAFKSDLNKCRLDNTELEGDVSNWIITGNVTFIYFSNAKFSGKIPIIQQSSMVLDVWAQNSYFSDINAEIFRTTLNSLDISIQNVIFPTANIDKLFKGLADYFEVNAPSRNCTINASGANMGIPTGGAANADITRLVGYYTAAGSTATVIVRTS